jgi:hypothetical protein
VRARSIESGSKRRQVSLIWSTLVPIKRASSNRETPAAMATVA